MPTFTSAGPARCVAAVLLAFCATLANRHVAAASGPTRVSALPAQARPAAVPDDYVVTPNGYFHPSCVRRLAVTDTLLADGAVRHADGRVSAAVPCTHASFTADGTLRATDSPWHVPSYTGWVIAAYFYADAGHTPGVFTGRMTVPPAPSVHGDQTDFLFPGMETSDSGHDPYTILQPVLGWNAFDDNAWTIASWNCCIDNVTNYSDPITVAPGSVISGAMTPQAASCSNGVCANWTVTTTDTSSGQSTVLNTQSHGQKFDLVFGAVLEVYGISQCAQYPPSGQGVFDQLALKDLGGAAMSLPWLKWDVVDIIFSDAFDGHSPLCHYTLASSNQGTHIVIGWNTN